MKNFFKSNLLIWIYFICTLIIELTAVFVTSGKFYIRMPFIYLFIQFLILLILLSIKTNKARHITSSILLILFAIIDLIFIVIYEMTGTIFDYGMFNLRSDAMAILESIPINYMFFAVTMLIIALYIVFGGRYSRHAPKPISIKWYAVPCSILIVTCLSTTLYYDNRNFEQNVELKLYRVSESNYNEYGMVGNFLNEFVKGTFFSNVNLGDEEELENFIYDNNSIYHTNFASSEEYNVVTILSESLEWHSFVQDLDLFVKGHNIDYTKYKDENGNSYTSSEEIMRELYPNLYNFYDTSIVATNFYSREKTDISENLSFLGAYPTNKYINYDFPNNTITTSMASVLKTLDDDITCNAFHNGSYTYYNRDKSLITSGFDSFTAMEQMEKRGMTDYNAKGERNLDSDMIEICKDDMFPKDKRFFTYITTITMHGQYIYRDNLESRGYYDRLSKFGITAMDDGSFEAFNHNNFYNYCASVMEFDRALGMIIDELTSRDLIDKTVISIFGDHNTYYSSLSNYVKGIKDENHNNYTNLYRVPFMIKYPNMGKVINFLKTEKQTDLDNGKYIINSNDDKTQILVKKFMCTADILPTLFDLCGINVYGNLYFGHSAFNDEVSVLYSRAYDVFITDSMHFTSLNKIEYIRSNDKTDVASKYAYLKDYDMEQHKSNVETEGKILLKKLSVCNRIFYNNYFGRKNITNTLMPNKQIFESKLISIN